MIGKCQRAKVLVAGCQSVPGVLGATGVPVVIPTGSWLLNSEFWFPNFPPSSNEESFPLSSYRRHLGFNLVCDHLPTEWDTKPGLGGVPFCAGDVDSIHLVLAAQDTPKILRPGAFRINVLGSDVVFGELRFVL